MKLKLIWEPEILFDKFNKFIKNFKIILKRNLNQIFLTNYTVINQKNGWTSESLKNGWLTYKNFLYIEKALPPDLHHFQSFWHISHPT